MKFFIKSLGCKTNALEGQVMAEKLSALGYVEVFNKNEADIYIINSCTVTDHADNQALYLIKQIRKDNPRAKVVLTGCFAQTADKNLINADLILGNTEKLKIDDYIKKLDFEKKCEVSDIFSANVFENCFLSNTKSTRPSVKIQDGCNNRCSYCLIPYARGNSRSNSVNNIINQINHHVKNGKKEIVLTGIHIGQWGYDTGHKKGLIELLAEIEKTDILRYRLGSLYVNEINDELFDFLISSKKFCPHFHLSLQSLCDKILKNMNRNYTKNEAMEFIEKIHKNFDLPFIGCDIITGFPTETDEDFEETKNALIEAKVSYIHSFPYSRRKGTKAFSMEGQVLEHIKHNRTKELIEVCKKLHNDFLNSNKDKVRTILYERKGKNGLYSGVSENYIKVYKKSDVNIQGTIERTTLSKFYIEHEDSDNI